MTGGVFGGGVIFVVAALLWAAVLVPNFMRRREFKAAEQNALRLQRTLRVLAETAEVPTEVRVEATAREALAQERMLRNAQRAQEAERQAQLAEIRAAELRAQMRQQQMKRKQKSIVRQAKLNRTWVRRVRGVIAAVFLGALVATLVGVGTLIAGLGALVVLSGLGALALSTAVLVLLAPGRAQFVDIDAEHVSVAPTKKTQHNRAEIINQGAGDAAVAAHAAAQSAAAARIDRAKAMARARAELPTPQLSNQPDSMLLHEAPAKTSVNVSAAAPARKTIPSQAAASPFANMGVIGDTSEGKLDLDASLRNRRAS